MIQTDPLPDKRRSETKTKIIGYRRVIHPEMSRGGMCGMCTEAADRRRRATIGQWVPEMKTRATG
jgi:hypothetical protein